MSSYKVRADRRRLKKEIARFRKEQRAQFEAIMAEADQKVYEARAALGRERYHQPVVWDAPVRVDFECRAPTMTAPRIALKLFALREVFDVRMMRMWRHRGDEIRMIEEGVALQIARHLLKEQIVAIDPAKEPTKRDKSTVEYDFAVYVGKPVQRRV